MGMSGMRASLPALNLCMTCPSQGVCAGCMLLRLDRSSLWVHSGPSWAGSARMHEHTSSTWQGQHRRDAVPSTCKAVSHAEVFQAQRLIKHLSPGESRYGKPPAQPPGAGGNGGVSLPMHHRAHVQAIHLHLDHLLVVEFAEIVLELHGPAAGTVEVCAS